MRRTLKYVISVLILACVKTNAAQYYVRTDGNDSNAGTTNSAGGAWLTIQRALNSAAAGDTVTVVAGTYAERADTLNSGSAGSAITLNTTGGTVSVRGFIVDKPYYVIDGFRITDYSPASLDGAIKITADGDNTVVRNCTFSLRSWVSAANIQFSSSGPTITAPNGGFSAAGFRAGMNVVVDRNTSASTPQNNGKTFSVSSVTDTVLTLSSSGTMVDETTSCILSGTSAYGLQIANGADSCLVHGNAFNGQGAPWVWMSGTNNVLTRNSFTNGDGWDAIVYSGTDNLVSWNTITEGNSVAYNASPDVLEHWASITTLRFTFANNFVHNWDGVIGLHKNTSVGSNGEMTYVGNFFSNTGRILIKMPRCRVINNTFYKVAYQSTSVRSSQDHALFFDSSPGAGSTDDAVIKNNVFLSCGNAAASTKGWYQTAPSQEFEADYNYVASTSPSYGAKSGFTEANGKNGGNPGFTDENSVFGLDGIARTNDDGFMPIPNGVSDLLDAGYNGMDIGGYQSHQVYYVSPFGSNSNSGTAAAPWLTLTYAETQITAGETLIVDFGDYNERPTIDAVGTQASPITWFSFGGQLHTKGGSSNRGFSVSSPYLVMDGFEITGLMTNDSLRVLSTTANSTFRNFFIHDTTQNSGSHEAVAFVNTGGNAPQNGPQNITVTDFVFDNCVTHIFSSAGSGHVFERHKVYRSNEDVIRCFGSNQVFRNITLYGMNTPTSGHPDVFQSWSTTQGQNNYCKDIVVENCMFINPFHYSTHTSVTFADNGASPDTITRSSGSWVSDGFLAGHNIHIWDAQNSGNNKKGTSADVASVTDLVLTLEPDETLTSFANDTAAKIVAFSSIQPGQMDAPADNVTDNVVFRNNVWYGMSGYMTAMFRNYQFLNNVFYNCTWNVDTVLRFSSGGSAVLKNNVFLGCGRNTNLDGIDPNRGWYGQGSNPGVYTGNYNYVGSSNYAAKGATFTELNGVNGGNPLFQDESDPLGPDGEPWTDDDGFRLVTGSPLIGAGELGADIGAYGEPVQGGGGSVGNVNATNTNTSTVTISQ